MKKFLFLGLAAMMAFTSCTKDQTLATAQNGAIGFDVAADKATRSNVDPSTTTANITNFAVYGFMNDATGVVFRDELVSGSNASGWTYQNTQYWTPNTYYFAALAPSNDRAWTLTEATGDAAKLGIGSVNFVNSGKQDLLYWAGVSENKGGESEDAPVAIKFNHLLSKVKFTFENQFDNVNTTLTIENIQINNGYTQGDVNLAVADWWSTPSWDFTKATADFVHKFGHVTAEGATDATALYNIPALGQKGESHEELLLFPTKEKEFNVTFTVKMWNGKVVAASYDHVVKVKTMLEMGKAYNFKAILDAYNVTGSTDPEDQLKPIEFKVEVIDWVEAGEEVEVNYETIDSEETIGDKTLASDAIVSGQISVNGTFDGKGYTVTPVNPEVESNMYSLINLYNGAILKDLVIDGKNMSAEKDGKSYGIRGINVREAGTYTIENVKVVNVTYPLHVATTAELTLNVSKSVLEGWTSYNAGATVNFEEVSFENGKYARVRPYGTTTFKNCKFEEGFIIDLAYLAAGETVTFENCTYNGVALTEDKISTVDGANTMKGTYTL